MFDLGRIVTCLVSDNIVISMVISGCCSIIDSHQDVGEAKQEEPLRL